MIHITLHQRPIRTGRIRVCSAVFDLATWHNAADGYMQATTTNAEQVTLATNRETFTGSLCIGNGTDAPRWQLWNLERVGTELRGLAQREMPDGEWEQMMERLARITRA